MSGSRLARTWSRLALVLALALVPSCKPEPAPFPQATIVVDTDLPVPQLASHLRVDVFDARGTWRSSRDFALRSAGAFPASFSVFLPDENASGDVLVRLRIRPDGAERDYLGERYRPLSSLEAAPEEVLPVPAGDGQPRLVAESGEDRTPATEPMPELTVDRLVRVRLAPGVSATTRVLLRGACVGRMADLAEGTSCVDATRVSERAGEGEGPDDGSPTAAGSVLRTQELEPPAQPPGTVAVRGGAFVLGGDELPVGMRGTDSAPTSPPRAVIVSGFTIDREEVTVARMRAAIASGFDGGPSIRANPGPLAASASDPLGSCTYRDTPDPSDPERESLPLTCVPFDVAQAFCRREGGDLPTEAQWEYAAAASGRPRKTRYPWGNDAPSCTGVVFARTDDTAAGATECFDRGFPFGLRGHTKATLDVSADGVHGLAGSVSEWVRGAPLAYDSACYQRADLVDPSCDAPSAFRAVRGGSFNASESSLLASVRARVPAGGNTPTIGFRCVHAR